MWFNETCYNVKKKTTTTDHSSWKQYRQHKHQQNKNNQNTKIDHSKYCIIEIDQNTEKSLGDWRKLAVTQTPMKDNQLTLIWTTLKE